jgi:hypothetical protein
MDFLDPKKKRAHRIRLFIGYGLMTVALGIATTILVFQAYGFDVDRHTGEVIQNGLVFVDSHPVKAEVFLNGESKGRADARLIIPAGNYTVELKSPGYRGWKRSFALEGSSIERLVYPFLFPEQLKTEDTQLYSATPGMATQSPDRRWVMVQQPGSLVNFDVIDIASEDPKITSIALPATVIKQTGAVHKIEMVEWSTDNRHVLVKHTFDSGFEFIMIDREAPANTINVNATFNIPLTQVGLRDKQFTEYYLYDANGGVLRRGNSQTRQLTPLLTNVLSYKPHGSDVILFVTSQGAPAGKSLVRILDGEKLYALRELPTDSQYFLEIARYDGRWYMAAGAAAEHKVYIYKDAFDTIKRTDPARTVPVPVSVLKVDSAPEFLSFSATARFIALQAGSRFSIYDAEMDRQYRYDTKLVLSPGQKVTWMDGHRLTVVSQDKLVAFDYDGINQQTLVSASPSFVPFYDRDYENLFTLGPSVVVKDRASFARTPMQTE